MCLLIVSRDRDHPTFGVVVAGNRDEERGRPASPPGLWVGGRHRVLAPRDRRHAGTWIGVSDRQVFAGLTNVSASPRREDATSRGDLVFGALDAGSVEGALTFVRGAVSERVYNGFQLAVADADRVASCRWDGRELTVHEDHGDCVVITNEHAAGELTIPDLDEIVAVADVDDRLDRLRHVLLDSGERSGRHRILKRGGAYGTVSSSLIAVPRVGPTGLVWRYAAGQPDEVPFKNYGNLARRLG